MPDAFGVYDDMKVWEYLDFFARCYGLPAAGRRRMIADLLELVDLGDKRDAYVQTLSRGMQQRLCLAHALVHDPKVLLLDEPASGLDPRARVELRELLRELRSMGKTIVISSHILPELEELCTSVAIVDRGQVLAQGRVADIEQRLRFGAVLRVRLLLDEAQATARDWFAADPDVASAPSSCRTARSSWASVATTPRPRGCWRRRWQAACRSSVSRGLRATWRSSSCRSRRPITNPSKRREGTAMTDVPIDARHADRDARSRSPTAPRPCGPVAVRHLGARGGSAPSASRSSAAGCAAAGRSSS